jgi:hypothetical protein
VTGIQAAITLYTLVMASLMITGGKIGAIIGRRRDAIEPLHLAPVIFELGARPVSIASSSQGETFEVSGNLEGH